MERFVQVLNAGPSKILKTHDSSTQTTESTNNLINTSKLKYLSDGFFKIISLDGNKLSALCQNYFKVVNGSINSSGIFLSHYKYKYASIMSKVEESRKNNLIDKDKYSNIKQTTLLNNHSNAISKQKKRLKSRTRLEIENTKDREKVKSYLGILNNELMKTSQNTEQNLEETWNIVKDTINKSAEVFKKENTFNGKNSWFNERCKEAIERKMSSFELMVRNGDLFNQLRSEFISLSSCSIQSKECLFKFFKNKFESQIEILDDEVFETELKLKISAFCTHLSTKWKAKGVHGIEDKFLKKYKNWLNSTFYLPKIISSNSKNSGRQPRPQKEFSECSSKTKKRRVEQIRCSSAAADLLAQSTEYSPSRPVKLRRILNKKEVGMTPYTPEDALAFILNTGISKDMYIQTRLGAKQRNADIYPSYETIKEAKKQCYPDGIKVTNEGAHIPLQNLLNHTLSRLIKCISIPTSVKRMELISKWGCDGSSGYSEYMQKPVDETEEANTEVNDSNLFLITFVPLRLLGYINDCDENPLLVWENPRPSSTRLCRPIKFLYIKETAMLIRQDVIRLEIYNLKGFDVIIDSADKDSIINCKFRMYLTMLDGKAINSLTNTNSSQTCYLCKSKPTEMNDLSNSKHSNISTDYLQYELKKPTIRNISTEQAEVIKKRRKMVHNKLHTTLGIRVDKVVQGKGTSNTGNVGRIFLTNYHESSKITGVDEDLIRRMPVSVHKILIHGAAVSKSIILPIGMMSEEAQEASNKIYRRVRERHTRKSSRLNTTEDLIHMMLQQSDPVISRARGLPKSKMHELPEDFLPLLIVDSMIDDDQ
ncbi:hypothetical protein QTP88_010104 [Uroleucon formosanum]